MTRRVDWSAEAADDFDRAIDYIAFDSEANGWLVSARVLGAIDLLAELPTGRQGRVDGIYEKVVQKTPYITAYSLSDNAIRIARIIRASRDWPEGKWPDQA